MLDPTSSATKLLEKRREMYELQEALQKDKEKFNEKETQFKKCQNKKELIMKLKSIEDIFYAQMIIFLFSMFSKQKFKFLD